MNTLWTMPNVLTLFRLTAALIIPFLFLLMPAYSAALVAFVLYVFAAITDYFDGYLARKLNQITPWGRMLDPIADKVMVVIVLFTLALMKQWDVWYFVIPAIAILGREIIISGLREFLAGRIQLPVTWSAKLKTTVQLFALGFLMFSMVLEPASLKDTGNSLTYVEITGLLLLWIAGFLSVKTGYTYIKIAFFHLSKSNL